MKNALSTAPGSHRIVPGSTTTLPAAAGPSQTRVLLVDDEELELEKAALHAMTVGVGESLINAYVGRLLDPDVFVALKRVVLRRKTLTFIDDRQALHT